MAYPSDALRIDALFSIICSTASFVNPEGVALIFLDLFLALGFFNIIFYKRTVSKNKVLEPNLFNHKIRYTVNHLRH